MVTCSLQHILPLSDWLTTVSAVYSAIFWLARYTVGSKFCHFLSGSLHRRQHIQSFSAWLAEWDWQRGSDADYPLIAHPKTQTQLCYISFTLKIDFVSWFVINGWTPWKIYLITVWRAECELITMHCLNILILSGLVVAAQGERLLNILLILKFSIIQSTPRLINDRLYNNTSNIRD